MDKESKEHGLITAVLARLERVKIMDVRKLKMQHSKAGTDWFAKVSRLLKRSIVGL